MTEQTTARPVAASQSGTRQARFLNVNPSSTQQAREQYLAIEALPTWPVDTRTRRRFGLNNVGLLLPLVGRIIERSSPWDAIGDVLRNLQT
jgi:hypothetical protein